MAHKMGRSHPSQYRLRQKRTWSSAGTPEPRRDPLVTPPHDRCDFRRRHCFMLAGDRAGNGQQEDRHFEGTPQEQTGTGSSLPATPKDIQAGWSLGPGIR
jgi:hypothetical protein